MIYFTSDTHFFHKNILKYCNRPYDSVDSMAKDLVAKWNSIVDSDNDVVYILGDFAFGGVQKQIEILQALKGIKILIRGNHDYFNKTKYMLMGFHDVHKFAVVEEFFCTHYPIYESIDSLNKIDIATREENDGEIVRRNYNSIMDAYVTSGKDKVLHGHLHDHVVPLKKIWQYNVGIDTNGYKPISIEQIRSLELING